MTAGTAGKAAADGIWTALRTLKEQWVVMMFAVGALFWARDMWEGLSALPDALAVERGRISALERRVDLVEAGAERDGRARPVLRFPGTRHIAGDARAGGWSEIRLDPIRSEAADCVPLAVDAFVVDGRGRWFSTQASIARPPALGEEGSLSFAIGVPRAVPPGRAEAVIAFVHDCGGELKSDRSPTLPFRVLD